LPLPLTPERRRHWRAAGGSSRRARTLGRSSTPTCRPAGEGLDEHVGQAGQPHHRSLLARPLPRVRRCAGHVADEIGHAREVDGLRRGRQRRRPTSRALDHVPANVKSVPASDLALIAAAVERMVGMRRLRRASA
jgi:hypothetical protein